MSMWVVHVGHVSGAADVLCMSVVRGMELVDCVKYVGGEGCEWIRGLGVCLCLGCRGVGGVGGGGDG